MTSPEADTAVSGTMVAVTGTATDEGGVVAGVEVSVDGGATWHPATGTDEWEYAWHVPEGGGTANILSRASDDTVNVETPSEGITVSHSR